MQSGKQIWLKPYNYNSKSKQHSLYTEESVLCWDSLGLYCGKLAGQRERESSGEIWKQMHIPFHLDMHCYVPLCSRVK